MKDGDFARSIYGVRVPKILYGTAWKKERTAALVERAVTLGFRGIDTACQPRHYDEAGVGAGVAACRKAGLVTRAELYLQTKFTSANGQDPARIPYDPKASLAEQVAQSFQASLRNLQTPYLDGLVLHSPLASERHTMEVWQALEAIFDAGGARQLGISNCYALAQLERLYQKARIKPAVVQNRFYAETRYDREIRAFCRKHQILYQSFWTLTANPQVLAHAAVQALASKYQRTPAQVLFRYLTHIGVIPLSGTTSEAHMREDLAIFDFELTTSECDALTALL
jgi:diketogulonate reductase-like aldo/keto reductase